MRSPSPTTRAGWPWLTWRGERLTPLEVPIPERSSLIGDDRLRRLRGERAPASFDELVPDSYRLGRGASRLTRRVRPRRRGHVPQLRAALGAAARLRPRRAAGQRPRLQPLRGRRLQRGRRPPLRGGPRPAARPGLGGRGDRAGARRRASGWPWSLPAPVDGKPLSHPDFDPVWAAFSEHGRRPGVPRLGVREPAAPGLAPGRARGRRAALRLDLLVPGAGGRLGQPDPERGARAVPRSARRRRRADGELGAALPPAHRRRVGLLRPAARRALPQAGRAPVGVLPAAGAGGRPALRDAEPPRAPGRRRHLHDRERLAACRGRRRPDGGGRAGRGRTGRAGADQHLGSQRRVAPRAVTVDLEAAAAERERLRSDVPAGAPSTGRRRPPSGVHHLALLCSDVERTIRFYQDLLGLPAGRAVREPGLQGFDPPVLRPRARQHAGLLRLPRSGPRPVRRGARAGSTISPSRSTGQQWDAARARLEEAGVATQIESEVSLYFSDPDGVRLELIAEDLGSLYGTPLH